MVIYLLSFLSLGSTIARLVKVSVYSDIGNPLKTMRGRIDTIYWTIIEMMTVVICANLPAMPALLRYIKGSSTAAESPSSTLSSPHDDSMTRDSYSIAHSKMRSWYDSLTGSVHRHSVRVTSRKNHSNDSSTFHSASMEEKGIGSRGQGSVDASEAGKSDGSPKAAATVSTNEYDVTSQTTAPSPCVGNKKPRRSNSSSSVSGIPLSASDAGRTYEDNSSGHAWDRVIYRTDEVSVKRSPI